MDVHSNRILFSDKKGGPPRLYVMQEGDKAYIYHASYFLGVDGQEPILECNDEMEAMGLASGLVS